MKTVFGIQFTTRDDVRHFIAHGTMMRTKRNLEMVKGMWPDAEIATYQVPTWFDRKRAQFRGQPEPKMPAGIDEWFGVGRKSDG